MVVANGIIESLYANDLSSVAYHAAIELDNLRLGRENDLSAVKNLLKLIKSKTNINQETTDSTSKLSPSATTIMSRAITNSGISRPITIDDLIQDTRRIEKTFDQIIKNEHLDIDVDKMRDFCIALSRSSANKVKPIIPNKKYTSLLFE